MIHSVWVLILFIRLRPNQMNMLSAQYCTIDLFNGTGKGGGGGGGGLGRYMKGN